MKRLIFITALSFFIVGFAQANNAKIIAYGFSDGHHVFQAICPDGTRYRILKKRVTDEGKDESYIVNTCGRLMSKNEDDSLYEPYCKDGNVNVDELALSLCR